MAENALVDLDIRRGEAIVRALDDAADPAMHPTARCGSSSRRRRRGACF
jgi:hypothetical protein